MTGRARRLPSRPWRARRAMLVLGLLLAGPVTAQEITAAGYDDPTTRYAHGVLGDTIEHGSLVLTLRSGERLRFTLPHSSVFEDTAPRLADLDQDGTAEVITVESDQTRGARIAIYDHTGRIATTPYIGTRNRWLAPLGAADLDGDGQIEIAYIDRPHLAKTLRIWRFERNRLTPVADLPGLTNHRIGERDIAGGIRTCTGQPEMILATADWTRLVSVSFVEGTFKSQDIGPHWDRSSFAVAMTCSE